MVTPDPDKVAFGGLDMTSDDIIAIRHRSGLSQSKFCTLYGLNVRTLQNWEAGNAVPDAAATTLFRLIDRAPITIASILSEHKHATGKNK